MTAPGARSLACLNLYATIGGAERALLELVPALDRSLFVPLVVLGGDGPLAAQLRSRGVEVLVELFPTPPLYALAWPPTLIRLWRAAVRLRRLSRARGIRLVQCGDVLALLLLLPTVASGARLVYQVNYLGQGPRLWLFRALARVVADAIVACSSWQREAVVGSSLRLAARTVVVPPGVELASFQGGSGVGFRAGLGLGGGVPLVGMLARYDVWKGHELFLDAAVRVLERRPETRFAMVGGALNAGALRHVSAYQSRVLARLARLGLQGRVHPVDHRDDVAEVLAALDVVVLPSFGEPFGMALVEAMAAGRPVVAADSGGPREIVKPGETGLLFRTGDAASLADAILTLLDDPARARALAAAGLARAREIFQRDRYARDMEAVYGRLA
jgi:glycosyltransferase involved in cell wall biosynthesis